MTDVLDGGDDAAHPANRVETNDEHAAGLAQLARHFELVHQWQTERDAGTFAMSPEPGSPLSTDDAATAPYQTSFAAQHALGVAVDHLHALRAAVQGGESLHAFAPYTLLRPVFESAATVCWLVGPASRDVRVTRRLQYAAADAKDQEHLTDTLDTPSGLDAARQRIREVAARRPGVRSDACVGGSPGYATIVGTGGDHVSIGKRLALSMWQICSGLTHGRSWATHSTLDREHVARLSQDVLRVRITSSASRVALTTTSAMLFVTTARALYEERASRHR